MCGLFGFLNYSNKEVKGLSDLTNSLADHASVRGTDATGISFVNGGTIKIIKEAKAAENMEFKHPDNLRTLIGHTRHSTQGTEKKNYNNHPFSAEQKTQGFPLHITGYFITMMSLKRSTSYRELKLKQTHT